MVVYKLYMGVLKVYMGVYKVYMRVCKKKSVSLKEKLHRDGIFSHFTVQKR